MHDPISLVVSLLDSLFTNDVTVTIDVGYGEVDGMALASGDLGASNWGTYTQANYAGEKCPARQSAPGSSGLPGSSPGQGSLYMSPAEAEALGFTNSVATEYVGFSNTANWSYGAGTTPPSNEYYFIGTVEHEITENWAGFVAQQPAILLLGDGPLPIIHRRAFAISAPEAVAAPRISQSTAATLTWAVGITTRITATSATGTGATFRTAATMPSTALALQAS